MPKQNSYKKPNAPNKQKPIQKKPVKPAPKTIEDIKGNYIKEPQHQKNDNTDKTEKMIPKPSDGQSTLKGRTSVSKKPSPEQICSTLSELKNLKNKIDQY